MVDKSKNSYGAYNEALRAKHEGTMLVNGVEVVVAEYLKDPQKYNSHPMDPAYVEKCKEHLEEGIKTKERLHMDPSTVKSVIH